MAFFYNTVISWAVFFMFSSFQSVVPWKSCNNTWNTDNCTPILTPEEILALNGTKNYNNNSVSSAAEFFTLV